jgi:methionyl-tRNA formyltransferase
VTLPAPILFFGLPGPFSTAPLAALLAAGAQVAAVIVPAGPRQATSVESYVPLPAAGARNLTHLAADVHIPIYAVHRLDASVQERLLDLQPAVACVACWRWRFPPAFLAWPEYGFLNLHPSLLPAYRGPYPLFWALRDGLQESGVTVHWMDEGLDSGDVALQAPLAFPEGLGPAALDRAAGELGGRLLVEALHRLAAGTLQRQPQPPGGSYRPAPCAADFVLDRAWSARHAFSFMRGVSDWGLPYPVEAGGETFHLRQALGYTPDARLPAPAVRAGNRVQLQFAPGALVATLA